MLCAKTHPKVRLKQKVMQEKKNPMEFRIAILMLRSFTVRKQGGGLSAKFLLAPQVIHVLAGKR